MTTETPQASRLMIVEAAVALALMVLAFLAIAASDVSAMRSNSYWLALVALFAVTAFVFDRLHSARRWADLPSLLSIALHWLGVLAAVELVHVFVGAGQMTNADTGLACGLILALGAFTAGASGNWRMGVIGAALGVATAVVAMVEQYLWVLLVVAVIAIVVMVMIGRFRHGREAAQGA